MSSLIVESPTGSKIGQHLVYQLAACNSWKLHKIDLKTAFLQGERFSENRVVFCNIPQDIYRILGLDSSKRYLWQLHKPVYGLNDAARAWFIRLSKFLTSQGLSSTLHEPALFRRFVDSKLVGIVLVYVDDLLISGNVSFITEIVSKFKSEFLVGSHEVNSFKYCGVNVQSHFDDSNEISGFSLDQSEYEKSLKEVPLTLISDANLEKVFRTSLGHLSWLSTTSRLDISFQVNHLATKQRNPSLSDIRALNKLIRYVQNNQLCLRYRKFDPSQMQLLVLSDSSFANNSDLTSQTHI